MAEADELSRDIWRLSFRLNYLVYSQAARQVLDLSHFGNGTLERLAAAMVLGAFFFFAIMLVSIFAGTPVLVGLSIAFTGLVAAWATSAVFVIGPPDETLPKDIDQTRGVLEERRQAAAKLAAKAATEAKNQVAAQSEDQLEVVPIGVPPRRQEPRRPSVTRCPFCHEVIVAQALKCKHCGEILDDDLQRERRRGSRQQSFYPLAAFLSWIFPGLGQIYKGQIGRGFLWMVAAFATMLCCLVVPGVVIWVIGIFDAAIYTEG